MGDSISELKLIEYFKENNATFDLKGCHFIYNNSSEGKEVLNDIKRNLEHCDEFMFSVAFLNKFGLDKIKTCFADLNKEGITGKILTTNYLYFNEPYVLRDLINIPNIEVRLFDATKDIGFHTKGYIFKKGEEYSIIIGSSNLTSGALTVNAEWNQSIKGTRKFECINEIVTSFYDLWNKADVLDEDYIHKYEQKYNKYRIDHKEDFSKYEFKEDFIVREPNKMQKDHIRKQNELIAGGKTRALLISATGTGKTHAAAFGIRDIKGIIVKRVLYVTHRENILRKSEQTFKEILGNNIRSAIFSGKSKDIKGADYIFATTSMMQKEENYNRFPKDYFDYIVYDEVHRLGENKAMNIIDYFKPKFFLGMTATPERTDHFNLYELFDYNITSEIRLMDALEENMLCPFNYYGITDLQVLNKEEDFKDFNKLTCDERVKHIMNKARYYGCSNGRTKGLIFVNRVDVGKELSRKFNERGWRTVFLEGKNPIEEREECFKRLTADDYDENRLDYILSVDVLNEGIDIPSINQIILLRPTESAIVFIQQIGRGLRKSPNKRYLNILDFIGNYTNNYMIAEAFNGNKNSRVGNIKTVTTPILPGESTIQFDKIAKERIYESIDENNIYSQKKYIKNKVEECQKKLGKTNISEEPITLCELYKYSQMDLEVFCSSNNGKCYPSFYAFLEKYKMISDKYKLSNIEVSFINYLSQTIGKGKRKIDANILLDLIDRKNTNPKNYNFNPLLIKNLNNVFNGSFDSKELPYPIAYYSEESETFKLGSSFENLLEHDAFVFFLKDLLKSVLLINEEQYEGSNDYVYYKNYSRKDFCFLSLLDVNSENTIYGYKIFKNINDLGLFVTYNKNLHRDSSVNYRDEFINESLFSWDSKNKRTVDSSEIKQIINWCNPNQKAHRILLFIQKRNSKYFKNNRDKDFIYVGEIGKILDYQNDKIESGDNVVRFTFQLKRPVNNDIFNYLTSSLEDEK